MRGVTRYLIVWGPIALRARCTLTTKTRLPLLTSLVTALALFLSSTPAAHAVTPSCNTSALLIPLGGLLVTAGGMPGLMTAAGTAGTDSGYGNVGIGIHPLLQTTTNARLEIYNQTTTVTAGGANVSQMLLEVQNANAKDLFSVEYTGATPSPSATSPYSDTFTISLTASPSPLNLYGSNIFIGAGSGPALKISGSTQFFDAVTITPNATPTVRFYPKVRVGNAPNISDSNQLFVSGTGLAHVMKIVDQSNNPLLTAQENGIVALGSIDGETPTDTLDVMNGTIYFNGEYIQFTPLNSPPSCNSTSRNGLIVLTASYMLCTCSNGTWVSSAQSWNPCVWQ